MALYAVASTVLFIQTSTFKFQSFKLKLLNTWVLKHWAQKRKDTLYEKDKDRARYCITLPRLRLLRFQMRPLRRAEKTLSLIFRLSLLNWGTVLHAPGKVFVEGNVWIIKFTGMNSVLSVCFLFLTLSMSSFLPLSTQLKSGDVAVTCRRVGGHSRWNLRQGSSCVKAKTNVVSSLKLNQ